MLREMYSQEEPAQNISFSYEVKGKWCPQKRKTKRRKRSSLSLRLRYLPSCKDAWGMLWMRQWMNYSGIGNKETENSDYRCSPFFSFSHYIADRRKHRLWKSKVLWGFFLACLYYKIKKGEFFARKYTPPLILPMGAFTLHPPHIQSGLRAGIQGACR